MESRASFPSLGSIWSPSPASVQAEASSTAWQHRQATAILPSANAIVKLTTGCVALRSSMFEPVPTTNKLLWDYFGHKNTNIQKTQLLQASVRVLQPNKQTVDWEVTMVCCILQILGFKLKIGFFFLIEIARKFIQWLYSDHHFEIQKFSYLYWWKCLRECNHLNHFQVSAQAEGK